MGYMAACLCLYLHFPLHERCLLPTFHLEAVHRALCLEGFTHYHYVVRLNLGDEHPRLQDFGNVIKRTALNLGIDLSDIGTHNAH